ncbi:MAG: DUF4176 domain-containing protein [Bacilli bacterium]|nr:DUF4176 domain-containing protein [Bacilli bacterium]
MKEKFLPIGTVVLLKGGKKRVMITSYLVFANKDDEKKKMFDYGGCTFPEGIIDSNHTVGFNHEDIEKVFYVGLEDEEEILFNKLLLKTESEIRTKFDQNKPIDEDVIKNAVEELSN